MCVFPEQIPKHLWSHFIRGIFDGDGCVTCGKYTNKMLEQKRNIVINFTGSVALLDFLKNHFHNHIGVVVGRGSVTGMPRLILLEEIKRRVSFLITGQMLLQS